jgi:magnesium transporter
VIRTRLYRRGVLVESDFDPARISDHLGEGRCTIWLDLSGEDRDRLDLVAEEFELNRYAVEDARHSRQRMKLDRYGDHVFLSLYGISLDESTGTLASSELACFAAPSYLVTVHKDDGFDMEPVLKAWDDSTDLAGHGSGFLLYGLLDVMVDGHFQAVQALDGQFEDLEDELFSERAASREIQRRAFELRKSLIRFRRLALPAREVVNALMRRDLHLVDEELMPGYQDVYDHVLRVTEWTESLRDLVSTILDTNVTLQGNRLNMIMKKLTGYAAIVAVPTLVSGYYGMNVRIWPAAGTVLGGLIALVLMGGLSVVLWLAFRRNDWL